eukprot:CAMPEP_0197931246 /NCGR_PEP_ID=MMETSP1439-20131203/106785_1 /TAXON_ID=66791 /ORGANISM="Gonyaulax spinifera, Strain CCMP409" /LENGTH=193 /DNA_ID=CAMNT_0043553979 /DNA_START=128 /DNA_END=705 /DNA_ORIENTATION=-
MNMRLAGTPGSISKFVAESLPDLSREGRVRAKGDASGSLPKVTPMLLARVRVARILKSPTEPAVGGGDRALLLSQGGTEGHEGGDANALLLRRRLEVPRVEGARAHGSHPQSRAAPRVEVNRVRVVGARPQARSVQDFLVLIAERRGGQRLAPRGLVLLPLLALPGPGALLQLGLHLLGHGGLGPPPKRRALE